MGSLNEYCLLSNKDPKKWNEPKLKLIDEIIKEMQGSDIGLIRNHRSFYFGEELKQNSGLNDLINEVHQINTNLHEVNYNLYGVNTNLNEVNTNLNEANTNLHEVNTKLNVIDTKLDVISNSCNICKAVVLTLDHNTMNVTLNKITDFLANLDTDNKKMYTALLQLRSSISQREDLRASVFTSKINELINVVNTTSSDQSKQINEQIYSNFEEIYNKLCDELEKALNSNFNKFKEMFVSNITNIKNVITAVCNHQKNAIYSVFDMPLLLNIEKSIGKGIWGKGKRIFKDVYEISFLCPVCGTKGNVYKKEVKKTWVIRLVNVLKYSLMAIQVISCFTPIPLPRLSKVMNLIPNDFLEDINETIKNIENILPEEAIQEIKNSLYVQKEQFINSIQSKSPSNELTWESIKQQSITACVPVFSFNDICYIKYLFQEVLGDSVPPMNSGLERVYNEKEGSCAWVCMPCDNDNNNTNNNNNNHSDCYNNFLENGLDCLAIKISLE